MKPSTPLIGLASVAAYLILGTHGFVAPGNLPGGVISRTHDVSSSSSCAGSSRPVFPTRHASRRHRNDSSSLLMMAAGKKRRRRKGDKGGASAAASGVSTASKPKQPASADPVPAASGGVAGGGGAGQLGDVLEGDRGVEELFSDDWSDMPANTGMVKSNVSSLCYPGTYHRPKNIQQRARRVRCACFHTCSTSGAETRPNISASQHSSNILVCLGKVRERTVSFANLSIGKDEKPVFTSRSLLHRRAPTAFGRTSSGFWPYPFVDT